MLGTLYLIVYDLRKQGRDYKLLYAELEEWGAIRVLQSTWCLKLKNYKTPEALLSHFKNFIDANDGLMVSVMNDWDAFKPLANPASLY